MVSADCLDHPAIPAQRYEQLVQSVVDYAIYMLDPTGHVVSWNAGAQRIKGYRADEVIGQHFSLFFTPRIVPTAAPSACCARRWSRVWRRMRAGGCARMAHSSGRWRRWT